MSHAPSVAVLGASGYLGAAVVGALRDPLPTERVLVARSVDEIAADPPLGGLIVNCVGYFGWDAARLLEANVEHARRVASFAVEHSIELVHVSSSAVFDGLARGEVLESTPPVPRSAYGWSKLHGENAVLADHPGASIVRPTKLFGGDDPRCRLHALVRHVMAGGGLPIPRRVALWGNFLPVGEAARQIAAHALATEREPILHLSGALPWAEFVALLGQATDTRVRRLRAAEMGAAVAVPLLRLLPRIPRRAERIVELWDRVQFASLQPIDTAPVLLAELQDVARKVRC